MSNEHKVPIDSTARRATFCVSSRRNYLPASDAVAFLLFSRAHRIYCYDYYEIRLSVVHSQTNSGCITLPVHRAMAHLRIKSVGTTKEEKATRKA